MERFWSRTSAWWKPKAGFLLSIVLLSMAVTETAVSEAAVRTGLVLTTILGFGLFGHLVNDWTDVRPDQKAGKSNTVADLSLGIRFLLLFISLALAILPWFLGLPLDSMIVGLLGMEFLLFLSYSVRPIRLKQYPRIAVLVDSLYAYTVPAVVLWKVGEVDGGIGCVVQCNLLGFSGLFIGLRHILNHHQTDRFNDCVGNSPNLSLQVGSAKLLSTIRRLFLLEVVAVLSFLIWITFQRLEIGGILLVIFLFLLLVNSTTIFPFVKVRFGKLPVDNFYVVWIGLASLGYLSLLSSWYLMGIPVFLLAFTDFRHHPFWEVLFRYSRSLLVKTVAWPYRMVSLAFNWALYYFRKWFLGWSEERNWGRHYAKRLEEQRLDARGNIAIFNQHFAKFSETFVGGQRESLDYRTYFYYGWPQPVHEQRTGHLVASSVYLRKLIKALMDILNIDQEEFINDRIADSLLSNKVQLILAHFGPMGVKLLPVANRTGIPLAVMFHGYDVWHRQQVKEYRSGYNELFERAAVVIGVSRDICAQLESLGCPQEKIKYLPAFVNPMFFNVEHRPSSGTVFLSVGRFSETKAPHLVIQAFKQVLDDFPDAQLVMVGNDDGEGLLKACKMMTKALRIEDKVRFRGRLSPTEVMEEMSTANIFIQHSVTTPEDGDKEGTPVAVMEAMAVGLPVVATEHGGIAELIEHGRTGLLVPEYDTESMAKQMLRLAEDSGLAQKIGKEARRYVRSNDRIFDHLKHMEGIIDGYRIKT